MLQNIILNDDDSTKSFDFKSPDPSISFAPFRIFNVGNSKPINLLKFVQTLENTLGINAVKNSLPMQPGDVKSTAADISSTEFLDCSSKKSSIEIGIKNFINWYKIYYQKN